MADRFTATGLHDYDLNNLHPPSYGPVWTIETPDPQVPITYHHLHNGATSKTSLLCRRSEREDRASILPPRAKPTPLLSSRTLIRIRHRWKATQNHMAEMISQWEPANTRYYRTARH